MTQVFVAAWVGVTVGWIGFGWALAEAPAERAIAYTELEPVRVAEGVMGTVRG